MSYLTLLLIFLAAPTVLLAVLLARRAAREAELRSTLRVGLPILLVLVLVSAFYSAPWDTWMIDRGVFVYPPAKVAAWIHRVPVEDLLLFALQGLFVGLWSLFLIGRLPGTAMRPAQVRVARLVPSGAIIVALLVGLGSGSPHATYASSILVWFGPLLIVQYVAGADALLARWRLWLAAIVPATLWLWIAEFVAIRQDIWEVDRARSVTLRLAGLPLEDLAIFLVGNLLVVQTILFAADPAMRARVRGWLPAVRRHDTPDRPVRSVRAREGEHAE